MLLMPGLICLGTRKILCPTPGIGARLAMEPATAAAAACGVDPQPQPATLTPRPGLLRRGPRPASLRRRAILGV